MKKYLLQKMKPQKRLTLNKINIWNIRNSINCCFCLFLISIISSCNTNTSQIPDPLEAGWNGAPVCEVLVDNDQMRALKCTFPPGVGHEKHEHAPHFGYTIKGSTFKITDDTGTREVNVPTGYDFHKGATSWHEVQNVGDSTAVFLIIEPK